MAENTPEKRKKKEYMILVGFIAMTDDRYTYRYMILWSLESDLVTDVEMSVLSSKTRYT